MFWLLGLMALGMAAFLLIAIISLIAVVWALIAIASSRKDTGYKVIWAVIVLLLGIIGALLYYFLEHSKR